MSDPTMEGDCSTYCRLTKAIKDIKSAQPDPQPSLSNGKPAPSHWLKVRTGMRIGVAVPKRPTRVVNHHFKEQILYKANEMANHCLPSVPRTALQCNEQKTMLEEKRVKTLSNKIGSSLGEVVTDGEIAEAGVGGAISDDAREGKNDGKGNADAAGKGEDDNKPLDRQPVGQTGLQQPVDRIALQRKPQIETPPIAFASSAVTDSEVENYLMATLMDPQSSSFTPSKQDVKPDGKRDENPNDLRVSLCNIVDSMQGSTGNKLDGGSIRGNPNSTAKNLAEKALNALPGKGVKSDNTSEVHHYLAKEITNSKMPDVRVTGQAIQHLLEEQEKLLKAQALLKDEIGQSRTSTQGTTGLGVNLSQELGLQQTPLQGVSSLQDISLQGRPAQNMRYEKRGTAIKGCVSFENVPDISDQARTSEQQFATATRQSLHERISQCIAAIDEQMDNDKKQLVSTLRKNESNIRKNQAGMLQKTESTWAIGEHGQSSPTNSTGNISLSFQHDSKQTGSQLDGVDGEKVGNQTDSVCSPGDPLSKKNDRSSKNTDHSNGDQSSRRFDGDEFNRKIDRSCDRLGSTYGDCPGSRPDRSSSRGERIDSRGKQISTTCGVESIVDYTETIMPSIKASSSMKSLRNKQSSSSLISFPRGSDTPSLPRWGESAGSFDTATIPLASLTNNKKQADLKNRVGARIDNQAATTKDEAPVLRKDSELDLFKDPSAFKDPMSTKNMLIELATKLTHGLGRIVRDKEAIKLNRSSNAGDKKNVHGETLNANESRRDRRSQTDNSNNNNPCSFDNAEGLTKNQGSNHIDDGPKNDSVACRSQRPMSKSLVHPSGSHVLANMLCYNDRKNDNCDESETSSHSEDSASETSSESDDTRKEASIYSDDSIDDTEGETSLPVMI